jgi:predicted esterase
VDKKDFSGVYAAWKAGGPSDLLRAREALREWQARQGEREDLQWRLESLFAEMALDRGDAPAATAHLDASIAAYPDAAYDDPARLSKFQHLVNRRAWLLAESEGREAAMSYAAARLESDPRFRYFYLPPWEDRLGVEERARLRRRVVEAYRARAAAAPSRERAAEAERFARELEAETQDDVAGVPSRELQAGGDANKRYFLIGPTADARKPERGYGLVVVLPGGDGGAAFLPFVKRLAKQAVPEGYLVAQLVSVEWKPGQFKRLVWPTEKRPAEGMKFSTEEFVEAVVADVGTKHALDARHVFTLAWSSGGPAAYAVSLRKKKTVAGSFIAMSVFRPEGLPPLAEAKGHAYFLYHSKADAVCPYRMAEDAVKALQDQGAEVQLKAYEGGHGWTGPVYDDVRAGLRWLEEKSGK